MLRHGDIVSITETGEQGAIAGCVSVARAVFSIAVQIEGGYDFRHLHRSAFTVNRLGF